jgi:hypothetical protein
MSASDVRWAMLNLLNALDNGAQRGLRRAVSFQPVKLPVYISPASTLGLLMVLSTITKLRDIGRLALYAV